MVGVFSANVGKLGEKHKNQCRCARRNGTAFVRNRQNHYICTSLSTIDTMNDFEELTKFVKDFIDARDWGQFHNPKDLALALSIEAAELNESFLWKKAEEAKPEKVREELADVIIYALLLAEKYGWDISSIVKDKMKDNAAKYPVEKAKGTAKKYTELQ